MPTAFEGGNVPSDEDEPGVLNPEQQKKLLDFDYFATSDEEVEQVAKQTEEGRKPKSDAPQPPKDEEGEGTEAEGEDAEPDEDEVEGDETEAAGEETEALPQDKQFQTELLTAVRSLQPPMPGRVAPETRPEDDPLPPYNFQVRKEIVEAIASDDPTIRAQAINAIANGVAMGVHAQVRAETAARTQQVVQNYMARHLTVRDESKKIQDDFYGTYPQLDKPAIRAAVVEVTKQVYDGKEPWSPRLRKRIAEETARQLGMKLAGPAGQQSGSGAEQNTQSGAAANGAKKPGRKPPRVLAGNARAGSPAAKNSQVDDIADTLFGSDRR